MAMSWILVGMLLLSLASALLGGQPEALSQAALDGAQRAVQLGLSLAGPICLWSAVGETMQRAGLSESLARLLAPALRRLFPEAWRDRQTAGYLSANVTANLLGLGNAATPMGIQAARRMAGRQTAASDELCRLVVLNTASIQLLPTTVAALRAGLGAAAPFDILPAVWLSSVCALTVGLAACRLLERWRS